MVAAGGGKYVGWLNFLELGGWKIFKWWNWEWLLVNIGESRLIMVCKFDIYLFYLI